MARRLHTTVAFVIQGRSLRWSGKCECRGAEQDIQHRKCNGPFHLDTRSVEVYGVDYMSLLQS